MNTLLWHINTTKREAGKLIPRTSLEQNSRKRRKVYFWTFPFTKFTVTGPMTLGLERNFEMIYIDVS